MTEDRNKLEELDNARDKFARLYEEVHGHLPIILGQECYEFFSQPVKITDVRMYGDPPDCEVTVDSRLADLATTEFGELSWKPNRRSR